MADEHLDAHRTAPLSKRAKKMKSVFAVGANVIIVCLVTRVDLNGRSATVHSRDVQRDCWIGTCCTDTQMNPTHCPSDFA